MKHFAVTILGNNSALPAYGRHPTSQIVHYSDQLYMVDCGEGTQMQLATYRIKGHKIKAIFISHLHGDHYFGLIGLINSFSLLGRQTELTIYGPGGLKTILELQLQAARTSLNFPLHIIELSRDQNSIVHQEAELEVTCFPTIHRIDCFGFKFQEIHKKRKLKLEEVTIHHIPAYFYSRLQAGEDYTDKEGQIIANSLLTEPPPRGRSYVYFADTLFDKDLAKQAFQADLVYHESTYLEDRAERAADRFHSTSKQAATLALQAEAKRLLIGHFSSIYSDLTSLLAEAREVYPNTEIAAEGACFLV